jgi:hypothetical protein
MLCPQAVTRARERLILTRPRWRYLPRGLATDATDDELRELLNDYSIALTLRNEEVADSTFLQLLDGVTPDRSVFVEENHSRLDKVMAGMD